MYVFVYGTLSFPEIVEALTGKRNFSAGEAELKGYRVVGLQDRPYPGLVKTPKERANGIVLTIDEERLAIFDVWEGQEYERQTVKVRMNGSELDAYAYIWRGTSNLTWSRDVFEKDYLHYYLVKKIPEFKKLVSF